MLILSKLNEIQNHAKNLESLRSSLDELEIIRKNEFINSAGTNIRVMDFSKIFYRDDTVKIVDFLYELIALRVAETCDKLVALGVDPNS